MLLGCGSVAFPAFRPGLGLAVSSPTDLHGLPFSTTGGFPACGRPLLAFASCMDSVVTSPTRRAPKGPSMRVHTRPLPSRDCRAVVPSQQRSIRRSRAPGGAAAGQVPRSTPEGLVRARRVVRLALFRGLSSHPLAEAWGCRCLPGHRRLVLFRPSVVLQALPKKASEEACRLPDRGRAGPAASSLPR